MGYSQLLILKLPITTAADNIFIFFFFINLLKNNAFDISCESSAWKTLCKKMLKPYFLSKIIIKKKLDLSATILHGC